MKQAVERKAFPLVVKIVRLCYNRNKSGTYQVHRRYVGLNFKLDVGLYQLDQQVACQRYRQNFLIATATEETKAYLAKAWGNFSLAPARAFAA